MKNKKYTCVIIDDNTQAISILQNLLQKYFKEIEISANGNSVAEGVELINQHDPDILFLDVEMPQENGTAIYDYIDNPRFKTIFITAFPDYAAKAFRLNSVDYLVKPIKPSELKDAIAKVKSILENNLAFDSLILHQKSQDDKITFTAVDTIEIFTIKNILYCKAENNYTCVFGTDKKSFVSKTLGHYEDLLTPYGFYRVNRSHLINMRYIERVDKISPEVILKNNIHIPISGRRKKHFFEVLSGFID